MKHGPEVRTADLRFEPGLELASMILTRLRPDQLNTVIFFEVGTTPQLFFVTNEQRFFCMVLSAWVEYSNYTRPRSAGDYVFYQSCSHSGFVNLQKCKHRDSRVTKDLPVRAKYAGQFVATLSGSNEPGLSVLYPTTTWY